MPESRAEYMRNYRKNKKGTITIPIAGLETKFGPDEDPPVVQRMAAEIEALRAEVKELKRKLAAKPQWKPSDEPPDPIEQMKGARRIIEAYDRSFNSRPFTPVPKTAKPKK